MITDEESVVAAIWADRIRWSRTADRLKKRLDTARTLALVLGGVGAIATTVTATLLNARGVPRSMVAIVAAVCLALATYVGAQFLTPAAIGKWTRARSISEAIKREVYQYRAVAGSPIGPLRAEVAEIVSAATDLLPEYAATPVPAAVPPPGPMTPGEYIRDRMRDQIDHYYRPKAQVSAERSRRLRRLALALGVVTAIVAALAAVAPGSGATALAPWVAALTTLSGVSRRILPSNGTTTRSSPTSRPRTSWSACSRTCPHPAMPSGPGSSAGARA